MSGANVLELSEKSLQAKVNQCGAVISCLEHNLSWKGIYGQPRYLVTDSIRRLCNIINHTSVEGLPVKFILMNTTGNQNRKLGEKIYFAQHIMIGAIRKLTPPHKDNEAAADYLQNHVIESNKKIEWTVVRPDSLIDEQHNTEYDIYPSPIRSAIFYARTTSCINVAHFMSALVTDSILWTQWKAKMPVI